MGQAGGGADGRAIRAVTTVATARTRRRQRVVAALLATALVGSVTAVAGLASDGVSAVAPTVSTLDGLTSSSAAASCWEIKQLHPASADGTYWIRTAALQRPEQFYCDMTTDGGGWVLIGRGREGWTFRDYGQQTTEAVRTTVERDCRLRARSPLDRSDQRSARRRSGQGPRRRCPPGACPQRRRHAVAGRALALRGPRHLVVGHRRRPPPELVLHRRCGWHRVEHQGLAGRDVERGRRRQPRREERTGVVHVPVERPRQERRILVRRRDQRLERRHVVPVRVRHGEPGRPVHPDVHPSAVDDTACSTPIADAGTAVIDDPPPAERSAGRTGRRGLGRPEDR